MRRREKRPARPLPPPLPPAQRTVGQLVGEAIRFYQRHFWRSLVLGVPVVAANALVWARPSGDRGVALLPLTSLLISLGYVLAIGLVNDTRVWSRAGLTAYVLAFVVFLPVPLLVAVFIIPSLAWLALVGLAVPVALVERLGLRGSLARGVRLARVDYVHVLGSFATLALVLLISQFTLYFVLREFASNTRLIAAALASLVVSPLVFLGSALVYGDQDARIRSRDEPGKE